MCASAQIRICIVYFCWRISSATEIHHEAEKRRHSDLQRVELNERIAHIQTCAHLKTTSDKYDAFACVVNGSHMKQWKPISTVAHSVFCCSCFFSSLCFLSLCACVIRSYFRVRYKLRFGVRCPCIGLEVKQKKLNTQNERDSYSEWKRSRQLQTNVYEDTQISKSEQCLVSSLQSHRQKSEYDKKN